MDLFVNGVKQTANTSAGPLTWGSNLALGRTSSTGYCLKGIMHLARLYSRALTDVELAGNRANGISVGLT